MMFTYTLRSLAAQRISTAIALVILATTSAVITVLWGLNAGFIANARGNAKSENAVVMTERATSESQSQLTPAMLDRIKVLTQVAHGGRGALVSGEVVDTLPVVRPDGSVQELRVRGVDPEAFEVHDDLRIRGRAPTRSEAGVLVGARLLEGKHALDEHGVLSFESQSWPIVGVITAPDSPFESEVWFDRTYLKSFLRQDTDNVAYAKLVSATEQPAFATAVARDKGDHLVARSEPEHYAAQVRQLDIYFVVIRVMLAVLFATMLLTSANTLHTSFLSRLREIATLMAIGFTRRRVMGLIVLESLILTIAGAALGIGIAWLAQGRHFALEELQTVYTIRIGRDALELGLGVALLTGMLGSIAATVQIFRLGVLDSLQA